MMAVIRQSYSDYYDKDRTNWDSEFFSCNWRNASSNQILQNDRGDQNPNIQGILRIFFLSEIGWPCSEATHFSLMPRSIMHVVLPAIRHKSLLHDDYLSTKQFYLLHMRRYVSLFILYICNYYFSFTGTALQVGRSRVRFPKWSLELFIDIILPAALWPWGCLRL
jgi:hypothetical protein